MSLEELWELFPIFLVEHNDNWGLLYEEMKAKEYESLKLGLGKQFKHNRDAYSNAKTAFVRKWTDVAKIEYFGRY